MVATNKFGECKRMSTEYNPDYTYIFTDKAGNTFELKGSDPLVKESITKDIPISVTEDGHRYIYPYVEIDGGGGVTAHMPDWFKNTSQYQQWRQTWASTFANATINSYSLNAMNDTLQRLGEEAATDRTSSNVKRVEEQPSKAANTEQYIKQTQTSDVSSTDSQIINAGLSTAMSVVAIVVAIIFASTIKKRIRQKEQFSGIGWGILNGLVGSGLFGLLCVVLAHSSINKELATVKTKTYAKYAKKQLQDFTKTYSIFFIAWLVIIAIVFFWNLK